MARPLGQEGFLEGSLSTKGYWNGTKFVTEAAWASDPNNPSNAPNSPGSKDPGASQTIKISTPTKNNSSTTALRYPGKIAESTDYVVFEFFDYNPPFGRGESGDAESNTQTAFNAYQTSGSRENATKAKGLTSVILFMPEDIQSQYGARWGGADFSTAAVGLSRITGTSPTAPNVTAGAGLGMTKSKIFDTILKGINEVTGSSIGLDQFMGSVSGTILNPNTEMLYEGSQLRSFSLSFKMTPRSDVEAKTIQKICNTFKKAMLPSFGGQALFGTVKAPSLITIPKLCQVTYMKGAEAHPYLPVYKLCAIAGVDVNYTADGAYATYKDGSPVSTRLSLNFKETKLLFSQDIDSTGGLSH